VTPYPPPKKVNGDQAAGRPVAHTTGAELRILYDPYECLEEYLGQNPLQNLAARRYAGPYFLAAPDINRYQRTRRYGLLRF